MFEAVRQVRFLRELIKEFGFDQDKLSTPVFCDNQTAILASLTDKSASKTRHFAVHINYIKEALAHGLVHIKYCPTENMLSDILTKVNFKNAALFTENRDVAMGVVRTHLYRQLDQRKSEPWNQQA